MLNLSRRQLLSTLLAPVISRGARLLPFAVFPLVAMDMTAAAAADAKLSALTSGSTPAYIYGEEIVTATATSRKYAGDGRFNVKSYGATGDGTTDDTTAIQNCINAALAYGLATQGARLGATVIFPPGVYKTTAALTFGSASSIRFLGAGRQCCAIIGSFTGYIIDKPDNNFMSLEAIEHLYVKNTSTNAASGAIRFNAAENGLINMCYVQGFSGIVANANANNVRISNCFVTNPQGSITANQVGIAAGQVEISNTSIQGWDTGILCTNAGTCIHNCRIEVNNYGVYVNGVTGFYLGGGSTFESNSFAVYVNQVSGGKIESLLIGGVNGAAPGGTNPQSGITLRSVTALEVSGVVLSVQAAVAAMDLFADGNISGSNVVLSGINASSWKMPPANAKALYTYNNCNQPCGSTTDAAGNVSGMNYLDLPGKSGVIVTTAIEGMQYDIRNSSVATFRASANGSGSSHVRVRYDANIADWLIAA